ncbi:MAG: GNAT family N-acetyltransferase [Chromatiales bacterium]
MKNIILELAKFTDAAQIAETSRRLIEHGLPWTWTAPRVARHIRYSESVVLAARAEGRLTGFAIMDFGQDRAHLNLLAVERSYQGRGIGRALVRWLEESAVIAGTFVIHVEVRAGNERARQFYRRLGYGEKARTRLYYSGIEDAICMARDLRVCNGESAT